MKFERQMAGWYKSTDGRFDIMERNGSWYVDDMFAQERKWGWCGELTNNTQNTYIGSFERLRDAKKCCEEVAKAYPLCTRVCMITEDYKKMTRKIAYNCYAF